MRDDRKVLSRGFESIISKETIGQYSSSNFNILKLDINCINLNPHQPRKEFNDETLAKLADSIKQNGVLQPILVTRDNKDDYTLVAGERRLRASKLIGNKTIPAIVMEEKEHKALIATMVENLQREDLNPIDEANAYQIMINEMNISHDKVSDLVGKPRSTISNSLRLLSLDPEVQGALINKKIEVGHAKLLMTLPLERQVELTNQIKEYSLTVRELGARIKKQDDSFRPESSSPPKQIFSTKKLQVLFKKVLDQDVEIVYTGGNKKKVTIHDKLLLIELEQFLESIQ